MIHISGLGVAGSYLYRRLIESGFDASAFEPRRSDYYLPCGYATNETLLGRYLGYLGMNAEDYVISRAEKVTFSGHNFGEISFGSKGMCTIEKKRLLEDLVSGLPNNDLNGGNRAETRIDATGVSRALLGKHENDYTMYAKEYLCPSAVHRDFYFYFFQGGHGYFWEFPIGENYHVGAGSNNREMIDERLSGYQKEIVTGRRIRLTPLFDGITKENIIGVGEAIGTVSPISGEGIIPSIKSSEYLFQAFNKYSDPEKIREAYSERLEKEFGYYRKLRELVRKIQAGERLGLSDVGTARLVKNDLEMFGIDFRLSKVIRHFI